MGDGGLAVERRDGALILRLASGPSNALTPGLRAALIAALAAPDAARIVITGDGAGFSSALAGADDRGQPALAALCAAVEAAAVPVVAVLHGLVMGPGAELALAAAARIAAPDTRIAFPEVALGLCPAGGTTRRLVHRIGPGAALQLLQTGRAVAAPAALSLGLVDGLSPAPLAEALTCPIPQRPVSPTLAADTLTAVAQARRAATSALPAVARIIACVEAGVLLTPDAHQAFETVTREDLAATPEAEALQAVIRAERQAARLPLAIARLRPPAVGRLALQGAHPDLVVLAQAALARGVAVDWHHPGPVERAASLAALDALEAAEQRAGRLTAAARSAGRAALSDGVTAGPEALLWVHAPQARSLPRPGGQAGAAHLVLAGAEGELGLALAPGGRVCELAVLAEETPEAIAVAVSGLRRIGLPPVLVGQRPVLGQRLVAAGAAALAALLRFGVPQPRIAEALEAFGARLPPGLPEASTVTRPMAAPDIVNRWLGALANEAFRLLDQGVARRPSDVDHLLVAGYGFPRWRGGPMHQAARRGLMVVRRDLRLWGQDHVLWSPAPLIDRLIQDGLSLADLDD